MVVGIFGGALLVSAALYLASPSSHQRELAGPVAGNPIQARDQQARTPLIDLRSTDSVRGTDQTGRRSELVPILLQRGKVNLTIQLPVGTEEGQYVVEFVDQAGELRLKGSGEAKILNFVTTLNLSLDTGPLTPGKFQLTVRGPGTRAITCPVEVL